MHEWTKTEVQQIKACWATDEGRMALMIVVEQLAGLHGLAFSNDALRMAHNEGRRSVGYDLARAINMPMDKLIEAPPDDRNGPLTATERAARTAAERFASRSR